MNKITWFAIISLLISMYAAIFLIYRHHNNKCTLTVYIKDQLTVDARVVNSYRNGFTSIKLCTGETVIYSNDQIIKIVEK
jgi:hypothetical protein